MLTKLVEKSGRKDWLFMKNCYKKVQGGTCIIEEVEALIYQGITIFYVFISQQAEKELVVEDLEFKQKQRFLW